MQVKTSGIILHQVRYTDSTVIVNIFTREFGRMAYFVRGANKKGSACRSALLQPLSIVEIEAVHHPRKTIQTIREMRVAVPFFDIPFNPPKNTLALFIAEILLKTLKHSENDDDLYNFIENSIWKLDTCKEGLGNFHLVFMIQLSHYLGFGPNIENAEEAHFFDLMNGVFDIHAPSHTHILNAEYTSSFRTLMTLDYESMNQMKLNRVNRSELLDRLVEYYQLHISDFHTVTSIDILHKIWD